MATSTARLQNAEEQRAGRWRGRPITKSPSIDTLNNCIVNPLPKIPTIPISLAYYTSKDAEKSKEHTRQKRWYVHGRTLQ